MGVYHEFFQIHDIIKTAIYQTTSTYIYIWRWFSLKRSLIIGIFIGVFIILPAAQVTLDYSWEAKTGETAGNVDKKSEYTIFIEIEENMLYLLQEGKGIKKYPVATGKYNTPSPLGSWRIVEKGDWGEGFGGYWMGLNVPWGRYGIHGTTRPSSIGRYASHGCIRMRNQDIAELYRIVPHGTRVVIAKGTFGPFGTGFRSLNPGDRGADVLEIQIRLAELGYFEGNLSGIYDDNLKHALHRFQRDRGLPVTNTISKTAWKAMGFMEFE